MPSLHALKSHLTTFFRPNNKCIFNIHDPIGIKYLCQIRLGLSPLRSHKKHHNFRDTPSDLCICKIGVEDTDHFLFKCPFYATPRITLATKVIGVLIRNNLNHLGNEKDVYLYGHNSMNDADNKTIILAVIKFIKDSNRFLSKPCHEHTPPPS